MTLPRGIFTNEGKEMQGYEPIAAALSVGIKGPRGAPIEKDRFHILLPNVEVAQFEKASGGSYNTVKRATHPAFAPFNTAPPEKRTNISCCVEHTKEEDCFVYRLQAGELPGLTHPKRKPVCMGNGKIAQRWTGRNDEYQEIRCPGQMCEFAQTRHMRHRCKPWMKFVARFNFIRTADGRGLPNLPFKYTSTSWNTVANFVGFFRAFREKCIGLGLNPEDVKLFGLPVVLQLQERTDSTNQHRFPTVSISVEDGDLLGWIIKQRNLLAQVGSIRLIESATQDSGYDPDLTSGPVVPAYEG